MKLPIYTYYLMCLILSTSFQSGLFAQSPVYDQSDVDAVATPLGGASMLETFLTVNIRKPFMAQVANVTGDVVIKAIVETNGKISTVSVVRGLRPDCDYEAVRAMSLFNAWKPAQKAGQPVRSAIIHSIFFAKNGPISYRENNTLAYYNANGVYVTGSRNAKYLVETPVDTLTGRPNGDLVTHELYYRKWDEKSRIPLLKEGITNHSAHEAAYHIGYKPDGTDWIGSYYGIREDGSVANAELVTEAGAQTITYSENGAVRSLTNYNEKKTSEWYPNGMLRRIGIDVAAKQTGRDDYQLIEAWDSTGQQLVRKGAGHMRYTSQTQSQLDSTRETQLVEEGDYLDGFRHGLWKGSTVDGAFTYEERFDKGVALGGKAVRNGKSTSYALAIQKPGFTGGSDQLYQFLKRNLTYPDDARKSLVSGTVLVSFTILPNGSVCNFFVKGGIDPSLDAEALRVAKATAGQWQTGVYRGEPVSMQYDLPIWFRLEKQKPVDLINAAGGLYQFYRFSR